MLKKQYCFGILIICLFLYLINPVFADDITYGNLYVENASYSAFVCNHTGSCSTTGDIIFAASVVWGLENETYNTTEDMIRAVNQTGLLYDIKIAWSNIIDKFITSVQSKWFYMVGTEITLNETTLDNRTNKSIEVKMPILQAE